MEGRDPVASAPASASSAIRKSMAEQIRIIKKAAELAQEKIDYRIAHNEHILQAIDVVEAFLRKKHRICYGGQAINAHLPEKYKFYDPDYTIPDYDFYTPEPEQDVRILVQDLKKAGFQEISAREGLHEGTIKLYVDYVPVADITGLAAPLYRILSKREFRVNGISYMDIHTLRMMMYLELSRPRGYVERWPKVYERIMLLNTFAPNASCRTTRQARRTPLPSTPLTSSQVEHVLQWIVQKQRVFAGLDLVNGYEQTLKRRTKRMEWIVRTRKPILFFSPTPQEDIRELNEELERLQKGGGQYRIKTQQKEDGGELLPILTILYRGNLPVLYAVQQTACHSYFQLPLSSASFRRYPTHPVLRIASVDTLVTLYFSLSLLQDKFLTAGSMECLANQLIQLSMKMRSQPDKSPFPFISLNCAGHQASLPSLIRTKVNRMTERKTRLKQVMDPDTPMPLSDPAVPTMNLNPPAPLAPAKNKRRRTVRRFHPRPYPHD